MFETKLTAGGRFLPAEAIEQLPGLIAVGSGCRALVARALSRVPHEARLAITAEAAFLLVGTNHKDYLGASLLQGRAIILLGTDILALPEREQVDVILHLAAQAVLRAQYPADPADVTDEEVHADVAAGEQAAAHLVALWQAAA